MSKKAKLKKQRHQAKQDPTVLDKINSQDFIGQMTKEGYRLQQIQRSPEIPESHVEPTI
jgi:hypothetical protein